MLFTESDIIHTYTRAEAIADGVLIDVTATAKQVGFVFPVAVTEQLYHGLITPTPRLERMGQSLDERLWDVLWMLRADLKTRRVNETEGRFCVAFVCDDGRDEDEDGLVEIELMAWLGPGDEGEPVITIGYPGEG